MATKPFVYQDPYPLAEDQTKYRYREVNSGTDLPAQIDIEALDGESYATQRVADLDEMRGRTNA